MKKILALLLALAMMLLLAACSGDDPNAGVYYGALSTDYQGDWLELKGNGKAILYMTGEELACKWTLEGESITVTNRDEAFSGTLHNGVIRMDFGDKTCVYVMEPVTIEDGSVRGHVHVWKEADCENSKTCADCGLVDGEPLGHEAKEANYQEASVCKNCGTVLEEKLQADMEKYGITEFVEVGVMYPYATVTSEHVERETVGEFQIISHEVVKGSEEYPEKEGYEWHIVQVEAAFFDKNAGKWGISVGLCYEDYYNIELSDDSYSYDEETGLNTRLVSYYGEEVPIYYKEKGSWTGWKANEEGRLQNEYHVTRAWQVPEGYDGSVIGFYNKYTVNWDDKHIYEVYDPAQFWLFRLNGYDKEL